MADEVTVTPGRVRLENPLEQPADQRMAAASRRRGRRARTGRVVNQPRSSALEYAILLRALSRRVSQEIARTVTNNTEGVNVRADADEVNQGQPWTLLFERLRQRTATVVGSPTVVRRLRRIFRRLSNQNRTQVARSLNIPVSQVLGGEEALLEQWNKFRDENLALITSLTETQLEQSKTLISEAAFSGMRAETLAKRLVERAGVAQSRAQLIARDQILKTNADLVQVRNEAAGVRRYKWVSSRDSRTRDRHSFLDGQVFSWSDPPVVNSRGDRLHPGQDIQCRCRAAPVIE